MFVAWRPSGARLVARRAASFASAVAAGALLLAPAARAQSSAAAAAPVGDTGLRPGAHEIVVDGVRFWYRVAGTGVRGAAPLVFLHGGPGYNSHSFATLAGPALERELRVVYYDQRGSGHSERPWAGGYAIARLVEDVEGLRRALGVPRIALLGHSFGGTLALEYAAKYPEHVARMILVGAASDIPAACAARVEFLARRHAAALAKARADTAGRGGRERDACDLAFNTIDGPEREQVNDATMFPDTSIARRMNAVDSAGGLRNTGELGGALFNGGLLTYHFAGAARVRVPTLILAGGEDWAIGLPQQRALARALPDARIVEYPRAGHFLYLDEPDRFTRDVVGFLRGPRDRTSDARGSW